MKLNPIALPLLLIISVFNLVSYGQTSTTTPVPKRTREQVEALTKQHQGEFDYLLGDWEFTSESKEWGKGRGFWSAVRMAEGGQVLDEYRVTGDDGETYFSLSTIRSYNALLDQWELIS